MAVYLGSNQIDAVMSPAGLPNIQTLAVSQNGTYSVSGSIAGYSPITVNVMPNIQSLTVSQSGTYSISGSVEGFSPVTVNVPGGSLKTVQAYSGTGSIYYSTSTSIIMGYSSTITFSNITTQPNNFIVALTPQIYNYNIDYGVVSWWTYTGASLMTAVFNIVYDGLTTQTYAFPFQGSALWNNLTWMEAMSSSVSIPLVSWNYNSITQKLQCTLNSSAPQISMLYFPTVPPDTSYISFGVYPKPAYTLYYN